MAETEVATNESEIQQQIQDGGWQIAWGHSFVSTDGRPPPESQLLRVSFPVRTPLTDFPDMDDIGPAAGARLWALTTLQLQAANANKCLADVPFVNVENAIRELERYLRENRIGTQQFGEIGIKARITVYRRWNASQSGPSGGPPTDPRQELPRAWQAFVGVRVVFSESPPTTTPPPLDPSRPNPFQRFKHQTGTLLHPTDGSFAFAFTDWNGDGSQDLIAIKKRGTGTGSIEVHIFSGATNFQNLLLTTGTPLPETADDDTYAFALVDWNRDGRPDLFAVQKKKTDSGTTEINIFSGASNFQEGLLRKVATRLPETDENTDFVVADWSGDGKPDLVAIHKRFTDTRLTEVQILAGKSNFEDEILRVGTRLRETDANWAFAATKWQGGSSLDLVCINRAGQSSTEVGILSGKSLFQEFLVSGSTALQRTDATFDFVVADWDGKGRPELVAVKKSGTGTRSTEVHVLGE